MDPYQNHQLLSYLMDPCDQGLNFSREQTTVKDPAMGGSSVSNHKQMKFINPKAQQLGRTLQKH